MTSPRRSRTSCSIRRFAPVLLAVALGVALAGCKTTHPGQTTGSVGADATASGDADRRRSAEAWGGRYRANPSDPEAAVHYAQALRATGLRAQGVAVLERAATDNPKHRGVLGAYGRALADVGHYKQALEVLERAQAPGQPDWRILSAQGAALDQLGRHEEAQRYYGTALRLAPDEPSVLSNLGLSYALSKDLVRAEATLRRDADQSRVVRGSGTISRWSSACRGALPKRRGSRGPTCRRRRRRPPISAICGRCSRSRTAGGSPARAP